MPAQGGVYLRDVSGHSAAIDSSGFMYVNVNGTLSVGNVNVSGQAVQTSGQPISFAPTYSGAAAMLSGLQVVTTVNTTTNISGNVVALSSGTNQVQIASGFNQVIISGSPSMWSGMVVTNSGQTLTMASGAVPNLSGNMIGVSGTVSLASGAWLASGIVVNISGQSVTTTVSIGAVAITSGNFTIISGNVFVTSGNITITPASTANLSGLMVVISGNAATSVSGNVILLQSGNAGAPVGIVGTSGAGATLSGITVIATITTNVSGQQVYLGSGSNSVTFVSGFNLVALSGTTNFSGLGVVVQSGLGVVPQSGLFLASGIVPASGIFLASGLIPNISGQAVSISGNNNIPSKGNPTMESGFGFSGAIVVAPAMYDASGQGWVPLTNNAVSGFGGALAVAQDPGTKVFVGYSGTAMQSGVPSLSGGVPITGSSGSPISTPVYQVTIRNLSGNNTLYVGGSGNRPFSGAGFPLYAGDGITQSISDVSLMYVFAATSGQFIQWIGSQY